MTSDIIEKTTTLPRAVITDLDGTLAIIGERNATTEQKRLMEDALNRNLAAVLTMYYKHGYKILVSTGRWEEYKILTQQWLKANDIHVDEIFMRPVSNYDSGRRLKEWYLENIIMSRFDIHLAFEDVYACAKMYRSHDIPCWLVNDEPYLSNDL